MDELLKTLITSSPSLVCLIYVVRLFLIRDKEKDQRDDQRDSFIQTMHVDHMTARSHMAAALQENAVATRENTIALQTFHRALQNTECVNYQPKEPPRP